MKTTIHLSDALFQAKETVIAESGELKATAFVYSTGVKAVRLSNAKGSLVGLPWMGQMIWRCEFLGRELTMKSIYDEPEVCSVYGESYGCFLMHCGLTAMGNPTAADAHPGHGELPVAKYRDAWIAFGEDADGAYVALGGIYAHKRCFECSYEFSPEVKLYAGATKLMITAAFENKKDLPLEYYYLCHINHRPVDGAKIVDTVDYAKTIVNHEVPDGYKKEWAAATNAYLDKLDRNPKLMCAIGNRDEAFKPEIVFCCFHKADRDGKAYTMQVSPDGTAVYVVHYPAELPYGTRWIARTVDEDALGMCLPATAEHKGRLYCQAHHQQRVLKPGKRVVYHMETGLLDKAGAKSLAAACARVK